MTGRVIDREGMEINRLWKAQQAKQQAAQQKAVKEAHHDVTATEKPAVIHPDTPKPATASGTTPEECKVCSVSKECKVILKLWYQHAPRPELVRAWCKLIDQHAPDMCCLSMMEA